MNEPIVIPVWEVTKPTQRNAGDIKKYSIARNKKIRVEVQTLLETMKPGQGFKVLNFPIDKVRSMISNYDYDVVTRELHSENGTPYVQVWVK